MLTSGWRLSKKGERVNTIKTNWIRMWNIIMKPIVKLEAGAHIYDTDTQEAKKIITNLRSLWATQWILGQFGFRVKTYSPKRDEEKGGNPLFCTTDIMLIKIPKKWKWICLTTGNIIFYSGKWCVFRKKFCGLGSLWDHWQWDQDLS